MFIGRFKNIIIFLSLIIFYHSLLSQQRTKELTLDDIFISNKFSIKTLRGITWLKNDSAFLYLSTDTLTKQTDIWIYYTFTGEKKKFIDLSSLDSLKNIFSIQNFILSEDENQILFTGVLPSRSIKSGGNFFLLNLKDNIFKQLTNTEEEQSNIKFSPNGKMVGFVRNNNIFVIDLATGNETQLTFDGNENILNGKFDWVYEEEWSIIDGWRWSPDNNYIAYWQLDQTNVPEYPLTFYSNTYPKIKNMKYPKAGENNSRVRIGIINLNSKKNIWVNLGNDSNYYVPRIFWMPHNNKLAVFKVNRLQNKLEILEANPETGNTKLLITEESQTWVDVESASYHFLKTGKLIWTSEKDGYSHIYLTNLNKKVETKQLTKGLWDVHKIIAIDESSEIIYFSSTETSPLERHLYKIDFSGKRFKRITQGNGSHNTYLSPNNKFYIDTYSNANTVPQVLLYDINGKLIRVIEENNLSALSEYQLSRKEFFNFKTSDGIVLNGWMMKPINFDPTKKYPVLLYVYGGPGSQSVLDQWDRNNLWYTLLTQKGYIIVSVDGRGTGARGVDFKKVIYKNLGKWETNDQIESAKYLSNLPYIDKNRIGIWGWSYGGYMACMSILLGNEIFKTAIAVAPVTDWKFYDTIYTERYMQTPQLNPEGYKSSSVLNYADKLKGKLLIIHGTTDDNVHLQNSIALIQEFQKYNKQFDLMFYPEKDHSIAGQKTRLHLYTLITDYIINNL